MDFTQAQTNVVRAVAGSFPAGEWKAAILDYEIREVADGYDSDYVAIVLMRSSDGSLKQEQFLLDRAARQTCVDLFLQRKNDADEEIAGFVLRIEQPGTFRFDFKDTLKRLGGVWDPETQGYLDNYLDNYQREKAVTDAS